MYLYLVQVRIHTIHDTRRLQVPQKFVFFFVKRLQYRIYFKDDFNNKMIDFNINILY